MNDAEQLKMNDAEQPIAEQIPAVEATTKSKKRTTKKERNKVQATARKVKRSKKSSSPFSALTDRRLNYKTDKEHRTAGGHPTVSTGDPVAKALIGLGIPDLKKIARENGLSDRWSAWEKSELNPGQLRMNLGNVLRGAVRNGTKVTVLGKPIAGVLSMVGGKKAKK